MDPHEVFFRTLAREELQLLVLRDILYEGSWEEIVRDLEDRRDGRPFVYKLQSRIGEDLERIEKLRMYEAKHGVNLGKYVALADLAGGPK